MVMINIPHFFGLYPSCRYALQIDLHLGLPSWDQYPSWISILSLHIVSSFWIYILNIHIGFPSYVSILNLYLGFDLHIRASSWISLLELHLVLDHSSVGHVMGHLRFTILVLLDVSIGASKWNSFSFPSLTSLKEKSKNVFPNNYIVWLSYFQYILHEHGICITFVPIVNHTLYMAFNQQPPILI